MKEQKKFERKLKLHKETIAQVSGKSMREVAAGSGDTCDNTACCCETTIPVLTWQNPCELPFTEPPRC
jgi:hypothetical protein